MKPSGAAVFPLPVLLTRSMGDADVPMQRDVCATCILDPVKDARIIRLVAYCLFVTRHVDHLFVVYRPML